MSIERKATVGLDHVFWWSPPAMMSALPTLTVRLPTGDVSPVFTLLRAPVGVTNVASDGRTLTLASDTWATARGTIGDRGGVGWLMAGGRGEIPVRILRFSGVRTAILADSLPHPVAGADNVLAWLLCYATLPAGTICATARRQIPWHVLYSVQAGADMPIEPARDEGVLHVVRQPFSSGLTHQRLVYYASSLGRTVPGSQGSWEPQIADAHEELVGILRERLADVGQTTVYEDDLYGHQFQRAHGLLTLSGILSGHTASGAGLADVRDHVRKMALEELDRVLRRAIVDLDRDGQIDSGEGDVDLALPPAVAGGTFTDSGISALEDEGWVRRTVTEDR